MATPYNAPIPYNEPIPYNGETESAGYRSHEAFWIGGTCAPTTAPSAGYLSYEALWIARTGAPSGIPPPPIIIVHVGSPKTKTRLPEYREPLVEEFYDEEEELLILLAALKLQ